MVSAKPSRYTPRGNLGFNQFENSVFSDLLTNYKFRFLWLKLSAKTAGTSGISGISGAKSDKSFHFMEGIAMLNNHFSGAPTVGSHDHQPSNVLCYKGCEPKHLKNVAVTPFVA